MSDLMNISTKEKNHNAITSLEVAEMVEKEHKNIIRDIRNYVEELNELKIEPVDFFEESNYKDAKGERRPCYLVTKKGCEFIAHKLTGIKGTAFTARYINRFHDMEDFIEQKRQETLGDVNETIRLINSLQERAGCPAEIQLLTAKTILEKNTGVTLPVMISADKQYFDATYIARKVGIYVKSSGKPAEKAVHEIIRRLPITDDMFTETWEGKGNWQGTVRKYSQEVIDMIVDWCNDNGYPDDIEYIQSNGEKKVYHVKWKMAA